MGGRILKRSFLFFGLHILLVLAFQPILGHSQEYWFQDSEARYMRLVPKSDGSALIIGWFGNPVYIEGKKIAPPMKSDGKYELTYYLQNTDDKGNTLWLKPFPKKVMVRAGLEFNQDFYIGGDMEEAGLFEDSPRMINYENKGFLSKLNSQGKWQWVLGTGGMVRDINHDKAGNILMMVEPDGSRDVLGGKTLIPGYTKNFVLAKVSPDGKVLWTVQISGGKDLPRVQPPLTLVNQVASDPQGNVYVGGHFDGKALIGSDTSQESTGITYGPGELLYDSETFVAKFSPEGKLISVFRNIEKVDSLDLVDLAVDDSGNAYLCGYIQGKYIWDHKGQKPPTEQKQLYGATSGTEDAFLLKVRDMKEVEWIVQPEGEGYDRGESLILSDNSIDFLMTFARTIKIQGKTFRESNSDSYKTDLLLLTIDLDGKLKGATQLAGLGSERGTMYGKGISRYIYGLSSIKNGEGSYDYLLRYTGNIPGDKINQNIVSHSSHLKNDLSTFKPGQKVKAKIDGAWYSGEINKTSERHYLLKMDNSQPEYWKWVLPVYIRPQGEKTDRAMSK